MCLGIPGKVIEIFREHDLLMARVDFNGVQKNACLEHLPEVARGDYVMVHVGYALSRIDPVEANRVFEYLQEIKLLDELDSPSIPHSP